MPILPPHLFHRSALVAGQRLGFRIGFGLAPTPRRFYTAVPPPSSSAPKPLSPHEKIAIYKDFGRPFAKVFLMAIVAYQALYWSWHKLEYDELEREKTAEVKALEDKVKELQKGAAAQ